MAEEPTKESTSSVCVGTVNESDSCEGSEESQ